MLLILLVITLARGYRAAAQPPGPELQIMRGDYPRVLLFRQSEFIPRGMTMDVYSRAVDVAMGHIGKCLREELNHHPSHIDYHRAYKQRHPEKIVLLHFNAKGRHPRFGFERYHAGHWLYFNGCRILDDLPATAADITVRVETSTLFKMNYGTTGLGCDDIGICALNDDGTPDWSRAEQTHLVAIDHDAGSITIQRGRFGTKPHAFPAGQGYAAAHVWDGPFGDGPTSKQFLWNHNLSETCPRDAQGRTCGDVLAEEVAGWFRPGGQLDILDGVQFDVLHHDFDAVARMIWKTPQRHIDADADGKPDGGTVDGVPVFGNGAIAFLDALRRRLPEGKLVLADTSPHMQRAVGLLDGIEVEGWPMKADHHVATWSSGFNLMAFWRHRTRQPNLNYAKHHWHVGNDPEAAPAGRHRLLFAAMCMTGAAVAHDTPPTAWGGRRMGLEGGLPLWDSLNGGALGTLGWLGAPLAPAVHLAAQTPDLLRGRWHGHLEALPGCRLVPENSSMRLTVDGNHPAPDEFGMVIPLPRSIGRHATIRMTLSSAAVPGFDPRMARLWGSHLLVRETSARDPAALDWRPVSRREWRWRQWGFVHTDPVSIWLYVPDLPDTASRLHLTFERHADVVLHSLALYAHPDTMVQEYERGAILANPGTEPFSFDVDKLFDGRRFRRLEAGRWGDPAWHTGEPVQGAITLPAKEALFVRVVRAREAEE